MTESTGFRSLGTGVSQPGERPGQHLNLAAQAWPGMGPSWRRQRMRRRIRPAAEATSGTVRPSVRRATARDIACWHHPHPGSPALWPDVVPARVRNAPLPRVLPQRPGPTQQAVAPSGEAPSARYCRRPVHRLPPTPSGGHAVCKNPKTGSTLGSLFSACSVEIASSPPRSATRPWPPMRRARVRRARTDRPNRCMVSPMNLIRPAKGPRARSGATTPGPTRY
jgi:hypothetical protein